jgi:RNA polymerase sigma-70 factor (ECF subfamily)
VLVAAGDAEAFTVLFNRYWDNIYGAAFALTKSREMAEDVVQEIFGRIWQKREALAAIDNFSDYLFILARNYIFSEFEKLRVRQEHVSRLQRYFERREQNPEHLLLAKEGTALIERAIAQLSPQQQQVFRLSRQEGHTHKEIAALMGISVHTVRNHMIRALQSLTEFLATQDRSLVCLCALIELLL